MGPVELYPFQKRGVQALRANIAKGIRAQILSSPTGSGKTEMGMEIMRGAMDKGKRRAEFVSAIASPSYAKHPSASADAGIRHGILMGNESVADTRAHIRVSSSPNDPRAGGCGMERLFVVDECARGKRGSLLEGNHCQRCRLGRADRYPIPHKAGQVLQGNSQRGHHK